MNYEWDPVKNLENIKKHKVGFEQAILALEDRHRLCFYDEGHSLNEDRYIIFGNAEGRVLFRKMGAYNENCSLFFGKFT